jgi:uncharacterized protein (TIGR03546 family)
MIGWLLRPGRPLVKVLTAADSPERIALGFALGMIIGLVPKGNLIALCLGVVLLSSRANLAAAALAAFTFSWLGILADPVSHRIGLGLLNFSPLVNFWTWLYNLPVVPWTAFNNTVVLGSFVLALALFYPVFRLMEPAAAWGVPRMRDRVAKYRIGQLLLGLDVVSGGAA